MKLSEQYDRRITKLNELDLEKKTKTPTPPPKPGETVIYTDKSTTTSPFASDNAADPTTWMKYSALTVGALVLILGKPAMLKLFGRKLVNQQGKVTRYNVFQRLKDKKALRAAGITKDEMRDIWIKFQKHIQKQDRDLIDLTVNRIKNGEITAKEGLQSITHLLPKGEKNLEYRTFLGFENDAIAKKAAKEKKAAARKAADAAGYEAPFVAPKKMETPWSSYYNSNSTWSNKTPAPAPAPAPTVKTGITITNTKTGEKISHPNITKDQYENLNIQQRAILKDHPNFNTFEIEAFNRGKKR